MKNLQTLVCILPLLGFAESALCQDTVSFNGDIRPILSNKCFACHGPSDGDRKAGLRLDEPGGEEGALTPRESGLSSYTIKPGDPEASELWHRVTTDDEDELMPPPDSHKAPLTDEERALVKRWIEEGAEYQDFWSFITPTKPTAPTVADAAWNENPIDRYAMARLEEEGVRPKPEADKRTLLRRVTFDLTGLPPTLEEIQAFLNDERPDAYERVVDDLLNRPAYGEHMTRYWADLVRLADTNGMHKDFHREFSAYRDWIIRSYNENMPYNEFVKYQLAGDLYENPTKDQLVASGFNRLHMIIDRGTALPEESLHKNIVDRVEAFGTVFLGFTVQCAQCHDHKFDPLTQKEYFQFYAFFNNFAGEPETENTPPRGLQPPFIHLANADQQKTLDEFDEKRARLKYDRDTKIHDFGRSVEWLRDTARTNPPWIWRDAAPDERKAEFQTTLTLDAAPTHALATFYAATNAKVSINGESIGRARVNEPGTAVDVSAFLKAGENTIEADANGDPGFAFLLQYQVGEEIKTFTTNTEWQARATEDTPWQAAVEASQPSGKGNWLTQAVPPEVHDIKRDIEKLEREKNEFLNTIPAAMVMKERDPPRPATMLIRGAYDAPGEPVERNTPAFLPPMPPKEGAYTRMDLAKWLTDPQHPLTARVAVNRFWQQLFGVGLVKTSEDFGSQGEWPSHPNLLDELAVRFVESDWNVKELMRLIVLSKTYKQDSDASPEEYRNDPDNRLLARGSRYRMDAEMIRDQILAVSGQLNREMYGMSVKPPQPPGLWEMVSMAEPMTYVADTDDNIYRRSLYTYWRRGMPPPQMTVMNAPSREFCVARRERTNTPLQALLLMNEQEWFNAAKACVQSTVTKEMETDEGLSRLYEKITSHVPSPDRVELMRQTLGDLETIYANDKELTDALTAGYPGMDEAERARFASWTMIAHGLLNLELTKVRR